VFAWGIPREAFNQQSFRTSPVTEFMGSLPNNLAGLLNRLVPDIGCLTLVWSIKHRLIIKLIALMETNLREESIKLNSFMFDNVALQ
jgi:hypothetical protein